MTKCHSCAIILINRTSRPEVFCRIDVLSLQLYQNETLAQVISCEFCEIFKKTFFHRTIPMAASVPIQSKRGNEEKLLRKVTKQTKFE